jgi:cbb3-type cytochrome oxidase subunit 3
MNTIYETTEKLPGNLPQVQNLREVMTTQYDQRSNKEDVKINVKMKLSALWVALMLLYIYADIFSLYRPSQLEEMISGRMGPFPVTQGSLLAASILMIIPAVMVFLSLTLKPKVNRWANIILGILYTLVNLSNLIGETWAFYICFGIVEIVLTFLIVGYAWKWRNPESQP